jgi:soluble lytic murein transglycosylase-like protein
MRDGFAGFALHDLTLRPGLDTSRRFNPNLAPQVLKARADDGAAAGDCDSTTPPAPRLLSSHVLAGRHAFWPLIAKAECRFGLPRGLLDSVVLAESGYDPSVVSPAGAAGLAQLMPATALHLGVIDRFDPGANVLAGARYLRQLLDKFGGNVPLALAAYNAGPTAVRHVRGVPSNGETPGYVRQVLGYWTAPAIGPMSAAMPARQFAQLLGFGPSVSN